MPLLSALVGRYLKFQEKLCSRILIVLGAAMTILILLQVFFRFVIYVPFPWSEECARYLMIWMGMLGSVLALQRGRHIGVMVIMEKLPPPIRTGVGIAVRAAVIGFLVVLFLQGTEFAMFNKDQLSPALEISMLVPYSSVPVGSVMMILVVLGDILETLFPQGAAAE